MRMQTRWEQNLRRIVTHAVGLGLAGVVGCGRPVPQTPAKVSDPTPILAPAQEVARPPEARQTPPKLDGRHEFILNGVVQAVEPDEGEVTIAHEAMPGFMDAMTMPFLLKDKSVLDDVRPGDIVHGPMVVVFKKGNIKDYELTDLTVTGTVPPPRDKTLVAALNAIDRPKPLDVGEVVPDFTVTTQTGATLKLSDLRGKVVAVTFIYTRCPLPDFCPMVDAKFAEVARRVGFPARRAEQVELISISFDPEHDTPEVLTRYAQLRGAKPPWIYAVASGAELSKIGPLLGLDYYPEQNQFAHNLTAAVIGPDGRLARLELGRSWTPADLARTMINLIPSRDEP